MVFLLRLRRYIRRGGDCAGSALAVARTRRERDGATRQIILESGLSFILYTRLGGAGRRGAFPAWAVWINTAAALE